MREACLRALAFVDRARATRRRELSPGAVARPARGARTSAARRRVARDDADPRSRHRTLRSANEARCVAVGAIPRFGTAPRALRARARGSAILAESIPRAS